MSRRKNTRGVPFSIDREQPGSGPLFAWGFYLVLALAFNFILYRLYSNGWFVESFPAIYWMLSPLWLLSLVVIVGPIFIILCIGYNSLSGPWGTDSLGEGALLAAIQSDAQTLARKRMQLTYKDEYGIPDTTKWEIELRRYASIVLPQKLAVEHHNFAVLWLSVSKNVERLRTIIDDAYNILAAEDGKIFELNPVEYEQYCSRRLEAMGWSASITRATGDQGADVLANKNGQSLVLQCKKYSKPVGNKAVQEAIAAQKYYRTDIAAVVTNQSFTKSARELADMSGILLLHHTELDLFS